MKPHVACLCSLVANDLLAVLKYVEPAPPLPKRHNLDGEKRTVTAALMMNERMFQKGMQLVIWTEE